MVVSVVRPPCAFSASLPEDTGIPPKSPRPGLQRVPLRPGSSDLAKG